MLSNDVKERFIEMRGKGFSYDNIAVELNVSKQTLLNWSKELETEIENFKEMEFDLLKEKYLLNFKGKIEIYGSQIQKIKEELDKRNYEDYSTDKLIDLSIKLRDLFDPSSQWTKFSNIETDMMDFKKKVYKPA